MNSKTQKPSRKTTFVIVGISLIILLILSFVLPIRKSGCLSYCPNLPPDAACIGACRFEHYNLWGMKLSEGYN
jgi:hypothetical protein